MYHLMLCVCRSMKGFIYIVCYLYAFTVSPLCRPGQIQTYNIGRREVAKVVCELEANPHDVIFTWKFNSSMSESLDIPASDIQIDRSKSIAHYTPMTEHVRQHIFFNFCIFYYAKSFLNQMILC